MRDDWNDDDHDERRLDRDMEREPFRRPRFNPDDARERTALVGAGVLHGPVTLPPRGDQ